jgi:hypothetical protein
MQVQAICVGLCAALFSVVMGYIVHDEFSLSHAFLLLASAITTASLASAILGCVTSEQPYHVTPLPSNFSCSILHVLPFTNIPQSIVLLLAVFRFIFLIAWLSVRCAGWLLAC